MGDVYQRIVALLSQHELDYGIMKHAPEGRTDLASIIRGHPLKDAAKSMLVEVEGTATPEGREYVLAVVPGDRRVDFAAIKQLRGGRKARLAPADLATELTGCTMGAVPPFAFHPSISVLACEHLKASTAIVFNAGRLDCSISLCPQAYFTLNHARPARISKAAKLREPA
ncbi:YbaK/EbsC family protein [Caenispirillum salinarum]|uniref:YbaK/EbsC family protein n=1 Tax=Caenispirillum salinarum TaxID=859058 RepID=UPI00384CB9CB